MTLLSVAQTAKRWGISPRRIQILCSEGRIPSAMRIGHAWVIPDHASKSRLTERCFIPGSQRLPGIDQVIIGGLSLARFRIFSLCPKAFYIPSPAQHAELPKLSPPNIFARSGSRDEPPMTACGGNFIGGEISRNKQSPL